MAAIPIPLVKLRVPYVFGVKLHRNDTGFWWSWHVGFWKLHTGGSRPKLRTSEYLKQWPRSIRYGVITPDGAHVSLSWNEYTDINASYIVLDGKKTTWREYAERNFAWSRVKFRELKQQNAWMGLDNRSDKETFRQMSRGSMLLVLRDARGKNVRLPLYVGKLLRQAD